MCMSTAGNLIFLQRAAATAAAEDNWAASTYKLPSKARLGFLGLLGFPGCWPGCSWLPWLPWACSPTCPRPTRSKRRGTAATAAGGAAAEAEAEAGLRSWPVQAPITGHLWRPTFGAWN